MARNAARLAQRSRRLKEAELMLERQKSIGRTAGLVQAVLDQRVAAEYTADEKRLVSP